jgi:hypothetical protein
MTIISDIRKNLLTKYMNFIQIMSGIHFINIPLIIRRYEIKGSEEVFYV